MEQEYKFQNRYGDSIVLIKVRDNVYKLSCKDDEYIRFGLYNYEDKGYYFVDPPGGPFMKVGDFKLGNNVLTEISMKDGNILLTFSEYKRPYDKEAAELNSIIVEDILNYARLNNIKFDTLLFRMDTTKDSIEAGKWLSDTDAILEIINEDRTIGLNE